MKVLREQDGVMSDLEVRELLRKQVKQRSDEEKARPLIGARRASADLGWRPQQQVAIIAEQARAPIARCCQRTHLPHLGIFHRSLSPCLMCPALSLHRCCRISMNVHVLSNLARAFSILSRSCRSYHQRVILS